MFMNIMVSGLNVAFSHMSDSLQMSHVQNIYVTSAQIILRFHCDWIRARWLYSVVCDLRPSATSVIIAEPASKIHLQPSDRALSGIQGYKSLRAGVNRGEEAVHSPLSCDQLSQTLSSKPQVRQGDILIELPGQNSHGGYKHRGMTSSIPNLVNCQIDSNA